MSYIIHFDGNLTSYTFYNELLGKLHNYFEDRNNEQLVFDFSQVKLIEPIVIPNLLCVGYIINTSTGNPPKIFIPDNISAGHLKRYLFDINFIYFASKYGLFTFDDTILGGLAESNMDKLNNTILFHQDETEQESWDKICYYSQKFINKYLKDFDSYIAPTNLILELSREIVENSKDHGKSFCFMTIQYNYSREKVYIAYSDCGHGFLQSFLNKNIMVKSEIEAIIEGIFLRYQKPFGLYSVIHKTLSLGGIVRIHSNQDQLVLTRNTMLSLDVSNSAADLKKILLSEKHTKNIRRNLKFSGVHIEIEIPLSKEEVNKDV